MTDAKIDPMSKMAAEIFTVKESHTKILAQLEDLTKQNAALMESNGKLVAQITAMKTVPENVAAAPSPEDIARSEEENRQNAALEAFKKELGIDEF